MMIDPDIRIGGFDAFSWSRLVTLFTPQPPPSPTADAEVGLLFVIESEDGTPLFAHHTARGPVRGLPRACDPATLRRICPARVCVVAREGALEELDQRTALRLSPTDDFLEQLLMMAQAIREMSRSGQLRMDPSPLASIPIPSAPMVVRALDVILPRRCTFVLCAWDGTSIDTALVAHRGDQGLKGLFGPSWLRRSVGPLGGDFRRDHRLVSDAVAARLAPVSLGIFAERDTLHALLRNPDPGAFVTAAATRELVVDPMPPFAALALGADAVRSVASTTSQSLGGVDLVGALAPIARAFLETVDVRTVSSILGFNPLTHLAAWLRRREDMSSKGVNEAER